MFNSLQLFNNNLNKKIYKLPNKSLLNLYYKKLKLFTNKKKKFRVNRNEKISNVLKNNKVYIHQGRLWTKLKLTKYHIGYKFGEFSCTKKPFIFRPKKKKTKRDSRR